MDEYYFVVGSSDLPFLIAKSMPLSLSVLKDYSRSESSEQKYVDASVCITDCKPDEFPEKVC
jgi:hypothetical protein